MSGTPGKAERKYLAAHAEPEARLSEVFSAEHRLYGHALVIPASGEDTDLEQTLSSIPRTPLGPVLTILVVNATPDAPTSVHKTNAQTLKSLARREPAPAVLAPNAVLYPRREGDLLVVDRATHEYQFPIGQGVGLARKIGADLALALVVANRIESPWIHVSDADVVFPRDYFQQVSKKSHHEVSALLYRFRHRPHSNPRCYEAALQYEMTLRYYVLGLRFARSPYAFHSIGSTLALNAGAYAQVRGFPRRTAAEDFYLLNKIAKVGPIGMLTGGSLDLSSRTSHRVPFGTGAAIARLLENANPQCTTYHPALFHHLRAWLGALEDEISRHHSKRSQPISIRDRVFEHAEADPFVNPEPLLAALEQTGALTAAHEALGAPPRTIRQRVKETFDGFRTLKLLHALRESGLPNLPLRKALGRATFLSLQGDLDQSPTSELASQIEKLDLDLPGDESRPPHQR